MGVVGGGGGGINDLQIAVGQNERARVTQVLVFGSIYQSAMLVHVLTHRQMSLKIPEAEFRYPQVKNLQMFSFYTRIGELDPLKKGRRRTSPLTCRTWLQEVLNGQLVALAAMAHLGASTTGHLEKGRGSIH